MAERTLSDADIEAICVALQERQLHYQKCSLGLTDEEAYLVRNHIKWYKRVCTVVGTVVVTAVIGGILALLSRGFWFSIANADKIEKIAK